MTTINIWLFVMGVISGALAMYIPLRIANDKKKRQVAKDIHKIYAEHERDVKQYKKAHKRELEEAMAEIKRVLPKLIRIRAERTDMPYQRFRLVVELDERMVHKALDWGNDEWMIQHIANDIGCRAIVELKAINFMRYAEGDSK